MQNREAIKEQMFARIEHWKVSGLSQKAYCGENNLAYHIFHYWYKRYRGKDTQHAPVSFVQLQVQPSILQPPVELLLVDGKRFLFHQPLSIDTIKSLIG